VTVVASVRARGTGYGVVVTAAGAQDVRDDSFERGDDRCAGLGVEVTV
jgi:hypothetical protein